MPAAPFATHFVFVKCRPSGAGPQAPGREASEQNLKPNGLIDAPLQTSKQPRSPRRIGITSFSDRAVSMRASTYLHPFKRFLRDTSANVAMIAALSIIPILGVVGLAIDFQMAQTTREQVLATLDAAVVAGTRARQEGADEATVRQMINDQFYATAAVNVPNLQCGVNGDVRVTFSDQDEEITGEVDCVQRTIISHISDPRNNEFDFTVSSSAIFGIGLLDVAFVLDVSGSMSSQVSSSDTTRRIDALRVAALEAIDTILPQDADTNDDVRIGIVTYNHAVNAGPFFNAVTGQSANRNFLYERARDRTRADITEADLREFADADPNDEFEFPDELPPFEEPPEVPPVELTEDFIQIDDLPCFNTFDRGLNNGGRLRTNRNRSGEAPGCSQSERRRDRNIARERHEDALDDFDDANEAREDIIEERQALEAAREEAIEDLEDAFLDENPVLRTPQSGPLRSTCVFERQGPNADTDALPSTTNPLSFVGAGGPEWEAFEPENQDASVAAINGGADRFESVDFPDSPATNFENQAVSDVYTPRYWQCEEQTPLPITNNETALNDYVGALNTGTVSRGTGGHVGIAWGWYLLSPNWSSVWGSGSEPHAYDEPDTAKALVIMTDGDFNDEHPTTEDLNEDAVGRSERLCDAIKDQTNILIYTIEFGVPANAQPASDGRTILEYCASGDEFAFDPSTSQELSQDFQAIATSIADLRITR